MRRSLLTVCVFSLAMAGCQAAEVGGSTCDAARQHLRQCSNNLLDLSQCNENVANAILSTPCETMRQSAGQRGTQSVKDLLCQIVPEVCNFLDGFGLGGDNGGDGEEEVGEEPWEEEPGEWEEPGEEEPWEEPWEEPGEEPNGDPSAQNGDPSAQNESYGGEQNGCGGETWVGRCENNTVIWCEGGEVQYEDCGGYKCDFSQDNQFFACL